MTAGELFESISGRLVNTEPVTDVYTAIGIVSDYLATRLFLLGSQLLREEITLNYAIGDKVAYLPDGLIGTIEPPFRLSTASGGSGVNLEPLPSGLRSHYVGKTGDPVCYELLADQLFVYPTPSAACSVAFEASLFPEKPTHSSDDIPFNGQFDYVFREIVLLVMLQGGAAVMQADQFIAKTIDSVDKNKTPHNITYRYFV